MISIWSADTLSSASSAECIGKELGFKSYSNRANDIWALGIILLNMITGRAPWTKAVTTDACFVEYLLNENYLREMLPVSQEANDLFRKIFACEPSERITISALRKEIIALETFYMTDYEIARAGEAVREAAAFCGLRIEPVEGAPSADNEAMVDVILRAPSSSPSPTSPNPARFPWVSYQQAYSSHFHRHHQLSYQYVHSSNSQPASWPSPPPPLSPSADHTPIV